MTSDPTCVVIAEKMAAGGDAIAHMDDGRVLFVEGALPGERVRVDVHTTKKDFAKGSVTEVLESSSFRVTPPCPALADGCGGCRWQHVAPESQLALKADIVRDALRRTARLNDPIIEIGGAVPAWEYRTTLRLAVRDDGRVGLRAAASHRVVGLDACMVAHPALAAMLPGLRVRGAPEVTLRVSVATGGCTVLPSVAGATVSGAADGVGVGGDAVLYEDVADTRLRVGASSFFQSGPAAADLLVQEVRAACGDVLATAGRFLDAYGGVGLFSATLGPLDAILVESSRSACDDARVNVRNSVVHCTLLEKWRPEPVRLAVADPARTGLGAEAARVLAATNAERIVLVSCDPVSLARDTTLLARDGYEHRGSRVLDLFPSTPHVEVVTVFDLR